MSACACVGPAGSCPCIRQQRGEVLPPSDVFISGNVLAYLTEQELEQFNELKMRALSRYIFQSSNPETTT